MLATNRCALDCTPLEGKDRVTWQLTEEGSLSSRRPSNTLTFHSIPLLTGPQSAPFRIPFFRPPRADTFLFDEL